MLYVFFECYQYSHYTWTKTKSSHENLRGHLVQFVLMQEMQRLFVYVCLFMLCLIAL